MQVSNKNLANLFESESKEGPLLQLFGISQITVFPVLSCNLSFEENR